MDINTRIENWMRKEILRLAKTGEETDYRKALDIASKRAVEMLSDKKLRKLLK